MLRGGLRKNLFGLAQICSVDLQPLRAQTVAQFGGRAEFANLAQVDERDAVASLSFVEIWRCNHDRQAVDRQMCERVPEFAARDRIDSRGRLIEQQDLRLRHQRAGERQLLLHAAAETAGKAFGKPVHVEHGKVLVAAIANIRAGDPPQIADVADVFGDREIGIKAERLGEITGLSARFACGTAEDFGAAGSRFHHAREDLEGGSLPRAVRSDESENFPAMHGQIDAADSLDGTVAFP